MKLTSKLDSYKKIRQTWEINPKTRIKGSQKKKSRAQIKQELRKELDQ